MRRKHCAAPTHCIDGLGSTQSSLNVIPLATEEPTSRNAWPISMYQFKGFKYSSHYWILKGLGATTRPLRILDVGTAEGYLGELLKDAGHTVVGLEKDVALAAKCAQAL